MKLHFKFSPIAFVMLFSISFYSQQNDVKHIEVQSSLDQININAFSLMSVDRTSKKLVGSSYLNKEFLPGKISRQETIYLFRYNAYKDEMEVELKKKSYYLPISSNYTVHFIGENKTYKVLNNQENEITGKGFYVVVYIGNKMSLFIKEKIKLYPEVPAKLGFSPYEPPKLSRVKDKLFLGVNGLAIEVPKRKKDFLKLFSGHEKEVEYFLKKNKLGNKKQEDLLATVKYYNTLN